MKIVELMEAVGGNNLYHFSSVDGAKGILSSGNINASKHGGQMATIAQTKLPTVSVTRDWSYAVGNTDTQIGGMKHDVVFILDRQKIENNYKTIGTSQSTDTRSGAFNTLKPSKRDHIRSVSPGGEKFQQFDTDNDRSISRAERDAFKQKYTDADGNLSAEALATWNAIVSTNQYAVPNPNEPDVRTDVKSGGEFEEAIPVKSGKLPIKNIVVGIYLNSDAAKNDPELANHPLRKEGR